MSKIALLGDLVAPWEGEYGAPPVVTGCQPEAQNSEAQELKPKTSVHFPLTEHDFSRAKVSTRSTYGTSPVPASDFASAVILQEIES